MRPCKTLAAVAMLSALASSAAFCEQASRGGPRTIGPLFSAKWIYDQVSPAVVVVTAADAGGQGELGTGSLIDGSHVLTNAHVVVGNEGSGAPFQNIQVFFRPPRITGDRSRDMADAHEARIVRYDAGLDLALLSVSNVPGGGTVLPIGDSDRVAEGDSVAAIGHPEGGGLWTLTQGIISTIVSDQDGVQGKMVFQTDASVNRGNSGGPLINADGEMIGINSSMERRAPDGMAITSVNFAIQSNVALRWLASVGWHAPPRAPMPGGEPSSEEPSEDSAEPAAPARPAPPTAAPIVDAFVRDVATGNLWSARWHVWCGVDPNAQDSLGKTPLTQASVMNRQAMVDFLLAHNADPNRANFWGGTPVMLAVQNAYLDVVSRLLAHGADVNAKEPAQGWTALMIATGNCDYDNVIVDFLTAAGAAVNAKSKRGQTPLMIAASQCGGSPEMVDALLSHGADALAADDEGYIALDYAESGLQALAESSKGGRPASAADQRLGFSKSIADLQQATLKGRVAGAK